MPEQTGIAKDAWLDFLWLELTNKCNLSRVHCYQRRRTLAVCRMPWPGPRRLGARSWLARFKRQLTAL